MLWYIFRDISHIRLYEYLHLLKDFPLEISRILFRTTLKHSDPKRYTQICGTFSGLLSLSNYNRKFI